MGAADAHQHTDSNRNDDGSYVVHGTLKSGNGTGSLIDSNQQPVPLNSSLTLTGSVPQPSIFFRQPFFWDITDIFVFTDIYSTFIYRVA